MSSLTPTKTTAPAVVATGVCKSFGTQPVLRGVDLVVEDGSLTAILGPSGSGKTTLLRLLAGFDRADGGTIAIGGVVVEGPAGHVPPEARKVGYVPQEISLFPHLDVRANVGFGIPRRGRKERVAELLAMTGIADLADRYPHQLSGGQQQRVALARALAPAPSLLLLDEPFSSLDASLRSAVRADVADILRQAGATAVLVTHDQDEALSLADRVAVLSVGCVAQTGPPQEVYDCPVDESLASFVGEANLLAGTYAAGSADTAFGRVQLSDRVGPMSESQALTVLFRPEQLLVATVGSVERNPGPGPVVPGTVGSCDYHGHDSNIEVFTELGPLKVRCQGDPGLAPGHHISLRAVGPVMAWARDGPGPGRTAGSAQN